MITQAGKRLYDELALDSLPLDRVAALILAVEAEAVAAERARLRDGVEGLPYLPMTANGVYRFAVILDRAAVLTLLEEPK